MNSLFNFLVDKSKFFISIIILLSLVSILGLPKFQLDASSDTLLLDNDPDLKVYRENSRKYGSSDFLVIAFTPVKDIFSNETISLLKKLESNLKNNAEESLQSRLVSLKGKKLDKLSLKSEADAIEAIRCIENSELVVKNNEEKKEFRNPKPPFTTSTLQQEASRKLNFSASRTMKAAQKLYEGLNIGYEIKDYSFGDGKWIQIESTWLDNQNSYSEQFVYREMREMGI